MLIYVKDAEYVDDYKIKIRFTNGETKTVDLEEHMTGEIFEPLKNKSYFKTFTVNKDTETIEWDNGADLAPIFLYNL